MNSLGNNKTNNDQINRISKQNEKNKLLVVSYITDENIERCWSFFSDILKCQGTASNIVINYKMDKGKNTFIIGNEFSCYWIGISTIHYKCIESKNNFGIRKIAWIIKLDIGFSIRKTYFIYPITNDDRTLIKLNLELIGEENQEPMDFEETREYYYKLQYSIINKIINIMDESKEYNYLHESFIVQKSQNICWNYIININNISQATSGEIGYKFICNGDPETIGVFWRCEINGENKVVFIKVKNISKPKKRNTWKYQLETFGTELKIIRQELLIKITKINNETSQISFLIEFKEKINKINYDYKKKKLNEIIQKIRMSIYNL
jgi:hypothetical protein